MTKIFTPTVAYLILLILVIANLFVSLFYMSISTEYIRGQTGLLQSMLQRSVNAPGQSATKSATLKPTQKVVIPTQTISPKAK